MNFRPEEELILCCARTSLDHEIENKICSLLKKNLEWSYLIEQAANNKLMPLLYLNLSKYPEYVPKDILDNLKNEFSKNSMKNFILAGKLFEILKLLKSNDIIAIPYKGPVLALLAYGDLNFREFSDLDIFIDKEDIFKSKELLFSLGYKPLYHLDHSQEKFWLGINHEYKLVHNKPKISLELHWDYPMNYSNNELIFDKNYITNIKSNGFSFLTFAPEELILILSLHAYGHLWTSISFICDIAQIIETNNELSWNRILDKASKSGISRILGVSLLLVKDLLGVNIPDEILNNFKNDKKVQSSSLRIEKSLFTHDLSNAEQLRLRENLKNGIKDYVSIFKPVAQEITFLPIPTYLYPLFYVIRIFSVLKNKLID